MTHLADRLQFLSGKKQYGYLKAPLKAVVDEIVDELARDPRVAKAYLSVRTVKTQMVEATFQIDTSALGALNTVYAIAVTPEDGELEINNPVKTASVLLVNGEV